MSETDEPSTFFNPGITVRQLLLRAGYVFSLGEGVAWLVQLVVSVVVVFVTYGSLVSYIVPLLNSPPVNVLILLLTGSVVALFFLGICLYMLRQHNKGTILDSPTMLAISALFQIFVSYLIIFIVYFSYRSMVESNLSWVFSTSESEIMVGVLLALAVASRTAYTIVNELGTPMRNHIRRVSNNFISGREILIGSGAGLALLMLVLLIMLLPVLSLCQQGMLCPDGNSTQSQSDGVSSGGISTDRIENTPQLTTTIIKRASTPTETPSTPTPAQQASDAPTVIRQSGQCYPILAFGNGNENVEEFYDYRSPYTEPQGWYHAYGELESLLREDTSQIFLYNGSEGTNLVFVNDGDSNISGSGGTVTVDITGLPAEGNWSVRDDSYPGQDDVFVISGTEAHIEWVWNEGNRSDGAVYTGLGGGDWSRITIEPQFNEDSPRYPYVDWEGSAEDNEIETWIARSANRTSYELNMSEPLFLERGEC